MTDPELLGRWFSGQSWDAWRAFLSAVFALPVSESDASVIRECTGRSEVPATPAREVYTIVGRRGGKSLVAALLAVYAAFFKEYGGSLAPGERATVMLLAADRRQARVCFRYITGLIDETPLLAAMIEHRTADAIYLTNRVSLEVHTSSFKSVREYAIATVILDEASFWTTQETSANPDAEVVHALRPALATISGSLLIAISSPYARRGVMWEAYRKHWGQGGDILVWQAPTRKMNPTVPQEVIDQAYEEDAAVGIRRIRWRVPPRSRKLCVTEGHRGGCRTWASRTSSGQGTLLSGVCRSERRQRRQYDVGHCASRKGGGGVGCGAGGHAPILARVLREGVHRVLEDVRRDAGPR